MPPRAVLAVGFAVTLLALAGCSVFGGKKKEAEPAAEVAAEAVVARYDPVEAVVDLDIGRTRDGYAVLAVGIAPGPGYTVPELRPRRNGAPGSDGFLDFDFVARAPDPALAGAPASLAARTLRAVAVLRERDLAGVRGVRVHGLKGGLEMPL